MFRRFTQRLSESMRRMMYGRYGLDKLNVFLMTAAVALCLVGFLVSRFFGAVGALIGTLTSLISYGLLFWYLFRVFSRNIEKRSLENRRYLTDRSNRYYRCPNCRQTVRVPRGRGKICIKCPKCGEKFVRKS